MATGPEKYLKIGTVAALFDVTPKTIRRWLDDAEMGFPQPVTFGGANLFRAVEIQQYQEKALEDRLRKRISGGIPGQTGTNRDTPKRGG